MIYTFKFFAASDVVMQAFSAEQIFAIIGKKGKLRVIIVSEIPETIANIESRLKGRKECCWN